MSKKRLSQISYLDINVLKAISNSTTELKDLDLLYMSLKRNSENIAVGIKRAAYICGITYLLNIITLIYLKPALPRRIIMIILFVLLFMMIIILIIIWFVSIGYGKTSFLFMIKKYYPELKDRYDFKKDYLKQVNKISQEDFLFEINKGLAKILDNDKNHIIVDIMLKNELSYIKENINKLKPKMIDLSIYVYEYLKTYPYDEVGILKSLALYEIEYEIEKYKVFSIKERPELIDEASKWFSSKWNIDVKEYQASMKEARVSKETIPDWFLCLLDEKIVGGIGIIENDFHDRKDLKPNLCALYVESEHRGLGIGGLLLNSAIITLARANIYTAYLITDLDSFYEQYGWKYYCETLNDDGSISKVYIHQINFDNATNRKRRIKT